MTKTAEIIPEIEAVIAALRDGRGPSRTGMVDLLRRALDALWESHCPCERESCKYPLCSANKTIP